MREKTLATSLPPLSSTGEICERVDSRREVSDMSGDMTAESLA